MIADSVALLCTDLPKRCYHRVISFKAGATKINGISGTRIFRLVKFEIRSWQLLEESIFSNADKSSDPDQRYRWFSLRRPYFASSWVGSFYNLQVKERITILYCTFYFMGNRHIHNFMSSKSFIFDYLRWDTVGKDSVLLFLYKLCWNTPLKQR